MNWTAYIDNYCERLLPGFWDEPLNAISNLAFWLAARVVWRCWQRKSPNRAASSGTDIQSLLVMMLLIGAGSFAFHTLAVRWAGALDVLFIALYLHFYLAVYLHRALGWRWCFAWLGVPLFFLASRALSWVWVQMPGAAAGYLSAWTVLLVLCAHSAWCKLPSTRTLVAAAVCFATSLSLRQLDMPLCSDWRWGTHFAWHVLNAVTLGLTTWAMVRLDLASIKGKVFAT
jgi:hypothetical protein